MEVTTFRCTPREIVFSDGVLPALQLFKAGSFYDERYGVVTITQETLKQFVENFKANVRKVDIALDYGHNSDGEAAGWFRELELRNDDSELWGKVEYTKEGKEFIESKKYRYVSPEFNLNYQDNETLEKKGAVLLGAGLTNRPVIKGMAPAIALRELTEKEKITMNEIEKLKADLEAQTKKFSEMEKKMEEQKKELEEKDKALAAKVEDKKDDKKMEEPGEMSPEDMMKKISEQSAKIAELEAMLAKQKEAVAMSEKSKAFDLLLSEGKVCEAQRDAYLKGDVVKFSELAQPVKLTTEGKTSTETETDSEDVETKLHNLAKKFSEDKKIPYHSAMSVVLSENKDLAKKYKEKVTI